MNITTILFDLDGTLLPMDQEAFTTGYFKFLAKKLAPYGYEPKSLVDAIWAGTAAMVKNDGSCTNEQAFWKKFAAIYGEEKCQSDQSLFEDFYANEFNAARDICGFNPASVETVHKLKECGYRVALATNPIFPHMATETRIRWAALCRRILKFTRPPRPRPSASRILLTTSRSRARSASSRRSA